MAFPNDNEPGPIPVARSADGTADRQTLKQFREQAHALGALWIILGGLSVALAAWIFLGGDREVAARAGGSPPIVGAVLAVSGLLWFALGVLTCLKQPWAVYTGLVLSYLSVVGNLVNLNLCALAILLVSILQAHRVIGWANRMRAAGVPLTAKP